MDKAGDRAESEDTAELAGEGECGASERGAGAGASPERARRRLESEFLLAVRRAGSVMQLLGAASAERLAINVTDLNCLNILALGGPMTAGELARRTGLTTASITGVLDRLEEAGFVRRERDPHDRRRVIVRLDAARGLRDVAPVFAPVVAAWRAAAARYTDDELRLILGFQEQLEQIMRDRLIELRGGNQAR
jgi:DNA-binding MarR family transcriptional regulator